jgi:hypothetical protein
MSLAFSFNCSAVAVARCRAAAASAFSWSRSRSPAVLTLFAVSYALSDSASNCSLRRLSAIRSSSKIGLLRSGAHVRLRTEQACHLVIRYRLCPETMPRRSLSSR